MNGNVAAGSYAYRFAEKEVRTLNEQLESRIKERTAELEAKNEKLERVNRLFVGMELRMVELKERIRGLEGKLRELLLADEVSR